MDRESAQASERKRDQTNAYIRTSFRVSRRIYKDIIQGLSAGGLGEDVANLRLELGVEISAAETEQVLVMLRKLITGLV